MVFAKSDWCSQGKNLDGVSVSSLSRPWLCLSAFAFSLLQVTVLFAGQHIAKSPFEVNVDKSHGDASKVTAQGPGLEPTGNIANKTTYFEIFTAGQWKRKGRGLPPRGLEGSSKLTWGM